MPAYDDPMWVAEMLGLCAKHEQEAVEVSVPRRNSIWVSRSSKRRSRVLWVHEGIVCLTFCDGVGVKQHKVEDLLRLYAEV